MPQSTLLKLKYNHSQTSIEFIMLIGVAILFGSVFLLAIQVSSADQIKERQNLLVKDTAYAIQDEINLASSAGEGYIRQFNVPDKINGMDYSAQIIDDMIYIKTSDNKFALALPIPKITGNIIKGTNLIRKENNSLKIN